MGFQLLAEKGKQSRALAHTPAWFRLLQTGPSPPVQHSCGWAAGSLPTGTTKQLGQFHPRAKKHRRPSLPLTGLP